MKASLNSALIFMRWKLKNHHLIFKSDINAKYIFGFWLTLPWIFALINIITTWIKYFSQVRSKLNHISNKLTLIFCPCLKSCAAVAIILSLGCPANLVNTESIASTPIPEKIPQGLINSVFSIYSNSLFQLHSAVVHSSRSEQPTSAVHSS